MMNRFPAPGVRGFMNVSQPPGHSEFPAKFPPPGTPVQGKLTQHLHPQLPPPQRPPFLPPPDNLRPVVPPPVPGILPPPPLSAGIPPPSSSSIFPPQLPAQLPVGLGFAVPPPPLRPPRAPSDPPHIPFPPRQIAPPAPGLRPSRPQYEPRLPVPSTAVGHASTAVPTPVIPSVAPVDDSTWLKNWLKTHRQQRAAPTSKTAPSTLSEGAELLKSFEEQSATVLEQLSLLQGTVTYQPTEEWDGLCRRTTEACEKLNTMLEQVSVTNGSKLEASIRRRKSKRQRLRRLRQLQWEQEISPASQDHRDELHRRIDEWQARRIAADISQRQEKSLRNQAGGALGEVRKKQMEAAQSTEILELLLELRNERKVVLRREGVDVSQESDEAFTSRTFRLHELWSHQTSAYDQEEKLLKVMLEEEKEEEVQRQMAKAEQSAKLRQDEKAQTKKLDDADEGHVDPDMSIFYSFYSQAAGSLERYINIRHQWDLYSAPVGTPGSCTVPLGWPTAPSSPALGWEEFVQKS